MKSDTRQYLAALAIATIYKFSWRRPWVLLKPAWAVLMSFLPWEKVSEAVYAMRNFDCQGCVLYYKSLRTCGSPLGSPIERINPLGCWCHLPTKNELKAATCWARQHRPSMNIGWRKELVKSE